MKKSTGTLVGIGFGFLGVAFLIGIIYEIGLNRPPLRYAYIPQSTSEYVEDIGRKSCMGFVVSKAGPFDWNNSKDLGQDQNGGWRNESDENFIVYYKHDKDAKWQGHAQNVLINARENTEYLKELFGQYFYSKDMNGRRLPIYLPDNKHLYASTIDTLLCRKTNNANTNGVIIAQVGPLGCLTKGIVINPICFERENLLSENNYVSVLKHEMAHYVFFSSLDYSKDIEHYKWVSEGIAEYFSFNKPNAVCGIDSIEFIEHKCKLHSEFPLESNSSYWAGESFFFYLEKTGGIERVKDFLTKAYVMPTDSVFVNIGTSVEELHADWVSDLRNTTEVDSVVVGDSIR